MNDMTPALKKEPSLSEKEIAQLKKYARAGIAAEAFMISCLELQSGAIDKKGQNFQQTLEQLLSKTITALDLEIKENCA